ncbi:MAG: hypothetical protein ACM3O6_02920 [Acidobacteriota bacterium]
MTTQLEEMRARVAAAKAAAKAAELTPDEIEMAALAGEEREAKAAAWTSNATRLDTDMTMRLAAAEARAAGRYLVGAVNVLRCFPVGTLMDIDALPGKGVVILREPTAEAFHTATREGEAKVQPHGVIYAALLCGSGGQPPCLLDERAEPKEDGPWVDAVTRLHAFCARYPGAAVVIGDAAMGLGGARAKADKRGRT